jgi:hypothetical protein
VIRIQDSLTTFPAVAEPWINAKAGPLRRFVDSNSCDRYSYGDETELTTAMQAYKLSSGRMFPTWCEVLEVIQQLGYRKPTRAVVR